MDQLTALATEPLTQLAAVDDARNIRRGYAICRSSDLFGWQVVTWAWGRLDRAGTSRTRDFPEDAATRASVRQLLARRASAPKRIGVAYTPVATLTSSAAAGPSSAPAWMPPPTVPHPIVTASSTL